MWEVTQEFGRAAGLVLNAGKSVRFARTPAGRAALRGQPGPPVAEAFLDLGVAQRAGPARALGRAYRGAGRAHAAVGPAPSVVGCARSRARGGGVPAMM